MCTGEISPTLQSVLFTLPQPRGEVRWWKGSQIWPFGNSRVQIAGAGGSKLKIKKLRTSDEGLYKCQGSKHCQHQGTCEIQTCLIALLTAGKSAVSIEVLVKGLGGHRRHKEVKEVKGLAATSEKKDRFKDNKKSYMSRMAWGPAMEQVYSDKTSSNKSLKEPQRSEARKGRDFMETRLKESHKKLDLMALVLNICPVPDKYSDFKVSSQVPPLFSGTFPGKPWHGVPALGVVVQVISSFNRPSKVFNTL